MVGVGAGSAATLWCSASTIKHSIVAAMVRCSREARFSTAARTDGAGQSRQDDDQALRLRGDMVDVIG